ncbi:MAG TPA: type II secretion system protein [Candidatus Angelobacter sp.]|nr:type II secretion system protein [Candidatus Angelobacter sp.]
MRRIESQAGFSLTEALVVLAIILVVSGLSLPNLTRTLDNARLKAAGQQIVSFYQDSRQRATRDNAYYEIISSGSIAQPGMCLNLDGDGVCDPGEPVLQLSPQIKLSNAGVPVTLDPNLLGFAPLTTDLSQTTTAQGNQVSGLAWNSMGLPCQRPSSVSRCSNAAGYNGAAVSWVQYLRLERSTDEALYAAVTVSPTGNIRLWTFKPSSSGGSWM